MSTVNFSNGAPNPVAVPVPLRDPGWFFSGLEGPQEVTKFKEVVTHDLRLYGLEKFLEQDISELAPNPVNYDLTIPSERRQLASDKLKIVEDATKAWTLVRNRFKQGSPAEALIKPTDQHGALNALWKIFVTQYDNRTHRRGALELMEKFFDNDIKYNSDLIANYIFLQDTIQEVQALASTPNIAAQIGISTPLATRLDFTSDTERISRFSATHTTNAIFPTWFPTILLLMRLAQMPNHKDFIKKFIFEYLIKSANQRLEDISVYQCYEQLKNYTKIWDQANRKPKQDLAVSAHYTTAESERTFFCAFHGPNANHSTKRCEAINRTAMQQERQENDRRFQRSKDRDNTSRRPNDTQRNTRFNRSPSPFRRERRFDSRSRSNSRERRISKYEPRSSVSKEEKPWQSRRSRNFESNFDRREPVRFNNFHTEIDADVWGSKFREDQALQSTYSSEIPPQFARTPPHYAYEEDIHPDSGDTVEKECHHIRVYCSLTERTQDEAISKIILADNACNAIVFNEKQEHLVDDKEPITGTIYGALGHQHGAITQRGFVYFMGVKCRCFIGNISKSCFGVNYASVYYGFAFHIENRVLQIYSKRSGRATELTMNSQLLSEMPPSLF